MFSLIVATSENNVIGDNNKLLWHLSEDLKRFKQITLNHTIIMGRKTFDSLPGVLPNRKHIILTRDLNLNSSSESVEIYHNLNEIIDKFKYLKEEFFIIGGGEIYNLFLPHCNKIYLTKVFKEFQGDTKFPSIDMNNWTAIYESEQKTDPKNGIKYQFINLNKQ